MERIKEVVMIVNNRISKDFIYFMFSLFVLFMGFMIGRTSEIKNNKSAIKVLDAFTYTEVEPNPSSSLFEKHSMTDESNLYDNVNSKDNRTSDDNSNEFLYNDRNIKSNIVNRSKIFGSRKGKYFYYEGCGGNTISPKNLVYYKSESDAIEKGKVLYGKCR